ncbi:unnamed protein product [Closterium sp. NIES-54]
MEKRVKGEEGRPSATALMRSGKDGREEDEEGEVEEEGGEEEGGEEEEELGEADEKKGNCMTDILPPAPAPNPAPNPPPPVPPAPNPAPPAPPPTLLLANEAVDRPNRGFSPPIPIPTPFPSPDSASAPLPHSLSAAPIPSCTSSAFAPSLRLPRPMGNMRNNPILLGAASAEAASIAESASLHHPHHLHHPFPFPHLSPPALTLLPSFLSHSLPNLSPLLPDLSAPKSERSHWPNPPPPIASSHSLNRRGSRVLRQSCRPLPASRQSCRVVAPTHRPTSGLPRSPRRPLPQRSPPDAT